MAKSLLGAIVPAFIVTRLALFGIAALAVVLGPIDAVEAQSFHLPPQPHAFLEAWARYDTCWYVAIAERGYRGVIGPASDMRAAFFPLFPGLVAALTPVARLPLIAGLIISNACLLVFLGILWTLIELDWNADVARRAMWIYLLFPSAFFLSGAYSESLLLVLTAGSLLMARRRRWQASGLLAGLATLARPIGVVTIVPLVIEFIVSCRNESREDWPLPLIALILPTVAAGVGYLTFAWWAFGDPLGILQMEVAVRGEFASPWRPFVDLWRGGARLHSFNNSLFDSVLALIAIAALPRIFTKVRVSYAVYAFLVVIIPLSGSLVSFNRLLLPSFPHAILLAHALNRPWKAAAILIPCGILEAVLMTAFATWHWVA